MKLHSFTSVFLLFLATWFTGVREVGEVGFSQQMRIGLLGLSVLTLFLMYIQSANLNRIRADHATLVFFVFFLYSSVALLGNKFQLFGWSKILECVATILIVRKSVDVAVCPSKLLSAYMWFVLVTLVIILSSSVFYIEESYIPIEGVIPFRLRGELIPMNSNDLGFMACALLIYQLVIRQSPIFVGFSFFLLVLSGSRICLAYGILSTLYFLMLGSSGNQRQIIRLTLVALSTGVIVQAWDFFQALFTRNDIDQLMTLHGRIYYWGIGLSVFAEYPFFGNGFYVGHRFLDSLAPSLNFASSTYDSSFIDILADTGAIGLGVFLNIFLVAFLSLRGIFNKRTQYFYLLSLGLIIIRGLTGPGLEVFSGIYIYFILIVYLLQATKGAMAHG